MGLGRPAGPESARVSFGKTPSVGQAPQRRSRWRSASAKRPSRRGRAGDFGPFFLKFCAYFPYTAKICLNGHELIFDRRVRKQTPGRFRTRVITEGVTPSLYVEYKHTRIKQYHKEGRALRTETTINDAHDFELGRRLGRGSSVSSPRLNPAARSRSGGAKGRPSSSRRGGSA
jgi:hypothetical protein